MTRKPGALGRQWDLMKNVPANPNWRSTRELHQRLTDLGHEVDIRTVQRDLDWLSGPFSLASEDRGKARYWQWMRGASGLEIPGMSRPTALVLQQADRYLRQLMPRSVLNLLEPYFQRAAEVLAHTQLADWDRKVMHIEPGPALAPPEVDPEVRDVVYEALLDGQQFECEYARRYEAAPRQYEVNPVGLVLRQGVIYLVCTLWTYENSVQLALHRIRSANLLQRPAQSPPGFSLERYVREDAAFSYPASDRKLRLRVRFDEGAAFHLTERRLSEDQVLKQRKDGRYDLTATVADTADLRWWLLGFGDGVEVLAPKKLRDEFQQMTANMARIYG